MKKNNDRIIKNHLVKQCPSCGLADTLRRSHSRNTKEKFFNHWTFYKTYRCKNCGWRGYLTAISFSFSSLKILFFFLVIIVLTAFVTFQILKRIL